MATRPADHQADSKRYNSERRKRLGQYFTGLPLARLLATLAGVDRVSSVIDPMMGSGDMLVGALSVGSPDLVGGVEIDPIAFAQSEARLSEAGGISAATLRGSAFSPELLAQLPTCAWDMVITNPPYVRYQAGARGHESDVSVPSALEVRTDLLAAVDLLDALDGEDRRLFRELVKGYSGLADLAVPAWILCAGMVRTGGKLAMVVPTTWLTRDYARPVHYLLRRWFDIECVVEDRDAAWFSEALVRTSLVVATRVPRRDSAFETEAFGGYPHLRLDSTLADRRSLVGRLSTRGEDPERAVARIVAKWKNSGDVMHDYGVSADWVSTAHSVSSLASVAQGSAWLDRVESRQARVMREPASAVVPAALMAIVDPSRVPLVTLADLGWKVGQGLRTGANQFFYADFEGTNDGADRLRSALAVRQPRFDAPPGSNLPVLRRQADLSDGYLVQAGDLDGRVLVFEGYALPEDSGGTPYEALPRAVAEFVRDAAGVDMGSPDQRKLIPTLSAVSTNVRAASSRGPARFWYQLPPLADRHRPSLLVARVNSGHPRTFLNVERCAVIDANFSTLWPTETASLDPFAMLAMLNSSWCAASMELTGTVLGGGALKVEASHLRRLAVPRLHWDAAVELSALGRRLGQEPDASETLEAINRVIVGTLGANDSELVLEQVDAVAREQRAHRQTRVTRRSNR